jgi:curved DNA-binding protein CbpA
VFLRGKNIATIQPSKDKSKRHKDWSTSKTDTAAMIDYYEFLQISPHADAETIHRVYRYLAGRLHPDNPESGDPEMFRMLKAAYDTLSNPSRRAEYDSACRKEAKEEPPLANSIDFLDSIEGEQNRRIALLAVLYYKRRANPRFPEVSLAEIERRMGFPRDYLDFTTWYLTKKGYVSRADNSDFSLTAEGVDYIESQRGNLPVLNRLLTDGSAIVAAGARKQSAEQNGGNGAGKAKKPIILPTSETIWLDRRQGEGDRRRRVADPQQIAYDRRTGSRERRVNAGDRRKSRQDRRAYAIINNTTIQ